MPANQTDEKLNTIIELLKALVAVELARGGVPQAQIAKRVKMATATVNKMLKGIRKEKGT